MTTFRFALFAIGTTILLPVAATAQDADTTVVFDVERTIEPTENGNGAEVTFHGEYQGSRDLSQNGNQGLDLGGSRTVTVTNRHGDALTLVESYDDWQGRREVKIDTNKPDQAGPADRAPPPSKPG